MATGYEVKDLNKRDLEKGILKNEDRMRGQDVPDNSVLEDALDLAIFSQKMRTAFIGLAEDPANPQAALDRLQKSSEKWAKGLKGTPAAKDLRKQVKQLVRDEDTTWSRAVWKIAQDWLAGEEN
jgi:hypothetical protein